MENVANVLQQLQSRVGSANWSNWQVLRWQYYDFVRLTAAGTSQLRFMVNPEGSTDPVSAAAKTREETNLIKSASFGEVYYMVTQIRTKIEPLPIARQHADIIADADVIYTTWRAVYPALYQLMLRGVFTLTIGQKEYLTTPQPFITMPPGFGVDFKKNASTLATTALTNQMIAQSNEENDVFNITPAILIEPNQTISPVIDFPEGNTPSFAALVNSVDVRVNIGLLFDGYIIRPAQ